MYPIITVDPSDEGEILQQKWMKWATAEQWKRSVLERLFLDFHQHITNVRGRKDWHTTATSEKPSYR